MKRSHNIWLLGAFTLALLLQPLTAPAATGDPDSFNPTPNSFVYTVVVQPDGKILLGGVFNTVHDIGILRPVMARCNSDGTVDTNFNPNVGGGGLNAAAVQDDGKILLGGTFATVGGIARNKLARINTDGTLDSSFDPNANAAVNAVVLQPDGKILVGGGFTSIGGTTNRSLARLGSSGTVDTNFNPNPNGPVNCVAVQPDGKILIGGSFSSVGGVARSSMARLNADGTLDTNFNSVTNVTVIEVRSLAVQPDGKILLGGAFSDVNGVARGNIGRLNTNGTLDTNFTASVGAPVNSLMLQADGKILLGGAFTNVNGVARSYLARLNADGTLDTSLNAGISVTADYEVYSVALQTDGKILVAGFFASVGGQGRQYIARLENDAATQSLTAPTPSRVQWLRGGTAPEAQYVTFESSTNGGASYAFLGNGTRISGGWELTGLSLPIGGQLRARAHTLGGYHNGSGGLVETVAPFGIQPEIAVTGNGLNIGDGDSTPSLSNHTDFGGTLVTSGTLTRTFTITNSGNTNLTLGTVTVGGAHAADFGVTVPPAASVAPNGSTTFQVTFDPSANGLRTATLSFGNNDLDENPFHFSIQGTGIGPEIAVAGNGLNIADGDVTPSTLDHTDFGPVNTNTTLVRTFTINNSGSTNLTLGTVTVSGANASDFTVTPQPASSVAPSNSTTFQVTFRPRAIGLRSASLSFPNSDLDENPFNFSIQGTGFTAPEIVLTGNDLGITDGAIGPSLNNLTDFGSLNVTGSTLTHAFIIANTGNTNLALGAVTLSGANASDFTVTTQPASLVAPDEATEFHITFDPSANGLRSAMVSFTNNDLNVNPFNFSIQGAGGWGVDPGFDPDADASVIASATQPDGRVLLGGYFSSVGGVGRETVARLNIDGTLDPSFNPGLSVPVQCLAVQPDGKILLGGPFNLARYGADGALDPTFSPQPDGNISGIALQPDGKILIGGDFNSVGGLPRHNLARLNADGTPDGGFIDAGVSNAVLSIALQPDGKVLIGGIFVTVGGVTHNRLARLNANGTPDAGFNPTVNDGVDCATLQPDGKILLAGVFTSVNGVPHNGLARINPDGTLDAAFNPGSAHVRSMALQTDGKIILAGEFFVTRLTADGSVDFGFRPSVNGIIQSVELQPDGKVLLAGNFFTVAGVPRHHIARMENEPATQSLTIPASNRVQWLRGASSPESHQVTFELSTDAGESYLPLGVGTRIPGGWELTGLSLPSAGYLRARAVTIGGRGSSGLAQTVLVFGNFTEIAVSGKGNNIGDGDSTPSESDGTDFGAVASVSGTSVRTFTITNHGTLNLTLGNVTVGGTHAADFVVSAQPGATVVPNGSTTFQVTFDPSASGLRTAALSFTNNDLNENPFNFSIQGTGDTPEIVVAGNGLNIADGDSAPSLNDYTDFGGVNFTGSTLVRTFTITNVGVANLTLGGVTVGGANAADFVVSAQPAATVAPNGSTTFQVTFNPSATGLRSATLSFINNDLNENPFNFSIQGTGTTPEIAVTGNGVDIANGDNTPDLADQTDFGGTSVRTFTITNSGTANLTLGSVTIGGPNAANFAVNVQPAATVAPNGSTTFQVTFSPTLGPRNATLSFTNNDLDGSPFTFSIRGTDPAPEIAVMGNSQEIANGDSTPDTLDDSGFGDVNITSSTAVRTFTITNSGTASLTLGGVTVGGPNAADFIVNVQPAAAVAPNGSTAFQVTFDPSAVGTRSATLSFTNNDGDENPFSFSIEGYGDIPNLQVLGNGQAIGDGDSNPQLPDHTDFGSVAAASGTVTRTFTIMNAGSVTLTLGAVSLDGPQAADFVVSAQPASTIAPNGSTTFQVTFDPSAVGLRSATVSFTSDDLEKNPFDFSIQGTGLGSEIAATGNGVNISDGDSTPSVADNTDFGGVKVTATLARTFLITNSGTANLTLGPVTVGGPHAADFVVNFQPAAIVSPNGSTAFQVTFNPSAIGLRNATLSFTNNDSDENPFNFSIQGTSIAPEIAVIGNGVSITNYDSTQDLFDIADFGSVTVTGGTLVRTFTITNTGNTNLMVGPVTLTGDTTEFIVSAQPAAIVPPNGSTTFQVTFDPGFTGLLDATLSFSNNDPYENPFRFNLQGIGIAPEIAVTPSGPIDFGNVNVTGGTLTQTFTITNSGTANLTLGPVTVGGTHAADFVVSAQPVATVAPNGSTTFQVTFDPSALDQRNASLSFTNNDTDENPFSIGLQGTGMAPEIAMTGNSLNIADGDNTPNPADHTDFGSVNITGSTLVRTFTINNSGNINLTLGTVSVSGPHAADFVVNVQPAASVTPFGNTTFFQVTFDPSAVGLRSATLSFTNNDSDENPFNFSIQGTGTASSNANLSALSLSAATLAPAFAVATTNYTANGAYGDASLTVTAIRADTNATLEVQINGAGYSSLTSGTPSSALALNVGANTLAVRVTAQDGTLKIYTVAITRAAAAAGDLDSLNIQNGANPYGTAVQPDGKTIIVGQFDSLMGAPRTNIARLNADGTLDTGFDPAVNGRVQCVAVQTDGKVLLGGLFNMVRPAGAAAQTNRNFVARLNADGTLDAGFDPKVNDWVYCLSVQADGKVVIAGIFTTLQPNGGAVTNRNRIARLNADGTLDTGFDPNANNTVLSVAIQADGKVLLGGIFTSLQPNGAASTTLRNRIARVNADGTLDMGFDPNVNASINSLAVQADDKVLVGGSFTSLQPNGGAVTNRSNFLRLNADGTLDTSFDPLANSTLNTLAVQADGKVLIGGFFTTLSPNGGSAVSRSRIARVRANGTLDLGFNPNANNVVQSLGLQADGKVLLGGFFATLTPNGAVTPTPRNGFARLLNDPATQSLTASNATTVSWARGGSSPEVSQVTFELSTDGGANWTALGNGVRVGTTTDWQLTGLALPAGGQLRARGRTTGGSYNGSSGLIQSVASFGTVVVLPPVIIQQSLKVLGSGAFQFTFTNSSGTAFNVLAATNVSLPASNWTVLGVATNIGGGLYQFTDPQATNYPRRFYLLRFP